MGRVFDEGDVDVDGPGLADPVEAPDPLLEEGGGFGEIVKHHPVGELEVPTFAPDLGTDHEAGAVFVCEPGGIPVAFDDRKPAVEDRGIDPEHFGANLFYASGPLPPEVVQLFKTQRAGDPADMVPIGYDAVRARAREWIDAGFSKFLLRPLVPPDDMGAELSRLADEILPLTT